MPIIYIEGNIGTGKSTFIENLKTYLDFFNDLNYDTHVILEPVNEWLQTKDSSGENILQKFYENQEQWAFTFQMNSFISRVKKIQETFYKNDNGKEKLVFVERSIYTDRHCFAKLCYENGKMNELEYNIYCKWNDWLSEQFNIKPDSYIYLRCPPNENENRIKERSRDSEEGIPIEYLKALHEKHDEWLNFEKESVPVYIIDAMRNFKDYEEMTKIVMELLEFVKKNKK